jgi:UDP-glucose 4-epimerase
MDKKTIESAYQGKNVAITGGLGMMGSSLAHRLVGFGANVLLIDNYLEPYGANDMNIEGIENKVRVNVADIRDKSSMDKLLRGQNFVFHFAGQVGHNISMSDPKLDIEINCLGLFYVLQACREGSPNAKIIFSGSRFEYGKIIRNPVDESHPTKPLSMYAANKLAGENYFMLFNGHYHMDTVVFRIANPYGPRSQMKHHQYSMVNWFLRLAMEGKDLPIFGDGSQVRDYIYIDDLIEAFVAAGASPRTKGQIYNVGSGAGTKFIDMANMVIQIVGRGKIDPQPWPKNYENVETGDYISNIDKIKGDTGWMPKVEFEEGLRRTLEYYKTRLEKYIPKPISELKK